MRKSALFFSPHNDDEVLGAGGTLAKLKDEGYSIFVCEVTAGPTFERLKTEAAGADRVIGTEKRIFLNEKACCVNRIPAAELIDRFSGVLKETEPEIVFLSHCGDLHSDHRAVTEAAMVALRPMSAPFVKKIYACETLSETEWSIPRTGSSFVPDTWSDISRYLDRKIDALKCYQSQLKAFPHPRSVEAVRALAAYRGSTIGAAAAEAFQTIRSIF